ncbi:MFS transporter [Saccharothrix sp. AJ9571]|nr:MFS transporter [Saccharothrix sp. AJ9571]
MKITMRSTELPGRAAALSCAFFALSTGYFMIVPLLAVYLSSALDNSPQRIGLILAVFTVSSQGSQVFAGIVADRWSDRGVLVAGVMLSCWGFVGFAVTTATAAHVLNALALGFGNAILTVVGKAVLAAVSGERRVAAFALRSMAVNLGSAIGPMIGGLLFGRFAVALYGAAAMYLALGAILIWLAQPRDVRENADAGVGKQFRALAGNRTLVGLAAVSAGFWFLFTQFMFTFPLYANDEYGLKGKVGFLFAVNAVVGVVLQYSLVTSLHRRLDSWRMLAAGTGLVGVSFLLLGLGGTLWWLVLFVIVFSFGEILVVPMIDVVAAEAAPSAGLAGALGFASLGWTVGGVLGNLGGGFLYAEASSHDSMGLFWTLNLVVGMVAAMCFLRIRRQVRREAVA